MEVRSYTCIDILRMSVFTLPLLPRPGTFSSPQSTVELALLLCTSLRALLLAMLGQRAAATDILDTIPALVDAASGGNPSAIRALPLSWDALLIASALSFLLGQGSTYRRLRAAVEVAVTNVPAEARWTFCLPEPGSDPRAYVAHECDSSSNICAIMCEIANKTVFGARPYYPNEQQSDHQHQQQRQQQQQFLHQPAPTMPAVVLSSPHHQLLHEPAATQHRYGYGYEGRTVKRMPSDLQGGFPAVPATMSFFDGDLGGDIGAGGGEGGAAAVPDDLGADGAYLDTAAYKRRRMMAGVDGDGCDGGGSFDPSNGGYTFPNRNGGGQHTPLQLHAHPVFGGTPGTGSHFDSTSAFSPAAASTLGGGETTAAGARVRGPGASPGGGIGGIDGEEDLDGGCSLGLARGLHNMSLSRLSGPLGGLQQDSGHLGRVPSEGIMDLSSSIGSFAMDMVGMDAGAGGAKDGDRLGSFVGIPQDSDFDGGGASNGTANKRPFGGGGASSSKPLRLASFSTYSTALCRSASSSSMLPHARGDDGSIGQCGSDLGHDIVASAEDFMDEEGNDDICGNILSVDAILARVSILPGEEGGSSVKSGGGGGSGGAEGGGGEARGGGAEASPPPGSDGGAGGGSPMLAAVSGGAGGGGGCGGGDNSFLLDEHQTSMAVKALADSYEAGDAPPPPPLSTQPGGGLPLADVVVGGCSVNRPLAAGNG